MTMTSEPDRNNG
uniref:Uncharacterized protein n=1 Tax=Rhizophora mucronata TaxID=61149 RepID=A0A2P2J624_RHIMU